MIIRKISQHLLHLVKFVSRVCEIEHTCQILPNFDSIPILEPTEFNELCSCPARFAAYQSQPIAGRGFLSASLLSPFLELTLDVFPTALCASLD